MKRIKVLCLLFVVAVCVSVMEPRCEAQAPSLIVSFLSCSPASCIDTGEPVQTGAALVGAHAQCSNSNTGQVVTSIDQAVLVTIANCQVPYVPQAEVEVDHTLLLSDDCGSTYVDYLRFTGLVYSLFGQIVYHASSDAACDGGYTGVTQLGTKPC